MCNWSGLCRVWGYLQHGSAFPDSLGENRHLSVSGKPATPQHSFALPEPERLNRAAAHLCRNTETAKRKATDKWLFTQDVPVLAITFQQSEREQLLNCSCKSQLCIQQALERYNSLQAQQGQNSSSLSSLTFTSKWHLTYHVKQEHSVLDSTNAMLQQHFSSAEFASLSISKQCGNYCLFRVKDTCVF